MGHYRVYVLSGDVQFVDVQAASADAAEAAIEDALAEDYGGFMDRAEFWETDTRIDVEPIAEDDARVSTRDSDSPASQTECKRT